MNPRIIVLVVSCILATAAWASWASPEPVTLYPVIDPAIEQVFSDHYGIVIGQHGVELRWNQIKDPEFQVYKVYFSLEPSVGVTDSLAIEIRDVGTTSAVVSGLNLGTPYYFRIFVVNQLGEIGQGSNEVEAATQANSYPFFDDVEGTLDGWDLILTAWDTTSTWSFSPTHCWTDSPDTNYSDLSDR